MQTPTQNKSSNIPKAAGGTVFAVILAISFSHLLNDALQSLIPAIYPLVKQSFHLNFAQVGLITLTFQTSASLLQPIIGHLTDRNPKPFSLPTGMGFMLCGLFLMSFAPSFIWFLIAVSLIGVGSSIFHPEAARVAFISAAENNRGLAQSIFQVGGSAGRALGPLLAALVVTRLGRDHIWSFGILALIAIAVLFKVGQWYQRNIHLVKAHASSAVSEIHASLPGRKTMLAVGILLVLIFSKYFYLASMTSYLTFFLIAKFGVSIEVSQLYLFLFLVSVPFGVMAGGPLGDRFGRKYVIWFSIVGAAPFTLALPHANLFWTAVLTVIIGLVLSSAFPTILVYAQELLPGKLGMISGLFYGFAFGMGGLGSALLGILADHTSIIYVFTVCAYLPLIGLIAAFLPSIRGLHKESAES